MRLSPIAPLHHPPMRLPGCGQISTAFQALPPPSAPEPFPSGAPTWLPLGLAAYATDHSNPWAPPPPHPVPPPTPLASLTSSSTPDSAAPPECVLEEHPPLCGTVVTPRPSDLTIDQTDLVFARHIERYRPSSTLPHASPCPTVSCPSLASDESLVEADWPEGPPLPRTAYAPFHCPTALPQDSRAPLFNPSARHTGHGPVVAPYAPSDPAPPCSGSRLSSTKSPGLWAGEAASPLASSPHCSRLAPG